MKIEEFEKGQYVTYIPLHAKGDRNHKDCERGVVSSWNDEYIFVRYFRNGKLQYTAEATKIEDLIIYLFMKRLK